MKEERLLRVLGGVHEKYIAEADSKHRRRKKTTRVKILLIAACLVLAFGLVACAANWFGLRDLLFPHKVEVIPSVQQDPKQESYEVDAISLAGFGDAPENKANIQWWTFLEEYHYYSASSNEVFAPGTSYTFYQVYDQTMADKLDEIISQYGLKLHKSISYVNKEELCDLVGGDFMGINEGMGYIYEDGSFHIDGFIELPDYGQLDYQMTRNVRGTFSDVLLTVGDINQWQEWVYTMKDGTQVTLALSPTRSILIAELSDSLVTINVLAGTETDISDIFSSGAIGKAEMEAFAESFDFSLLAPALPVELDKEESFDAEEATEEIDMEEPVVSPEPKEDIAADGPNLPMLYTYTNRKEAYADLLEDLLIYRIFPDGCPYEPFDDTPDQFAITDINGDGAEELLLSASNTYSGGMRFYVLDFDEKSGKLGVEMLEWPALTFYENGLAKAELSHNQGRAGDALWPYTLYRYDAETRVYMPIALVDAWDRQFGETYLEEPFPAEADISGTGVVYYVMDAGNYELKNPMDISEYRSWCEEWFASKTPIQIPWESLTDEAIQHIRESD